MNTRKVIYGCKIVCQSKCSFTKNAPLTCSIKWLDTGYQLIIIVRQCWWCVLGVHSGVCYLCWWLPCHCSVSCWGTICIAESKENWWSSLKKVMMCPIELYVHREVMHLNVNYIGHNLTILKIPPQQASTPTCETKCETRLLLETKHVVNGNDVIHPWLIFRGGGQISVNEYIVQKCQFWRHYDHARSLSNATKQTWKREVN